jgi:hypothetical protein
MGTTQSMIPDLVEELVDAVFIRKPNVPYNFYRRDLLVYIDFPIPKKVKDEIYEYNKELIMISIGIIHERNPDYVENVKQVLEKYGYC